MATLHLAKRTTTETALSIAYSKFPVQTRILGLAACDKDTADQLLDNSRI